MMRSLSSTATILVTTLAVAGCDSRSGTDASSFERGRSLVLAGKFQEALGSLKEYLEEQPKGKQASRAWLFVGKAHLGLDRVDDAREAFATVTQQFPRSLEAHKCRYKLALLDLIADEREAALRNLRAIESTSGSPLRAEARAFRQYLED